MAIKIVHENNCVGCPQGCVHCGRDKQGRFAVECDVCGEEVDKAYLIDGEMVCADCLDSVVDVVTEDNAIDYFKE